MAAAAVATTVASFLSLPFMSAAVPLEIQFVSHSLVCLLTCLFACSLVHSLSPYKHVLSRRPSCQPAPRGHESSCAFVAGVR